MAIDFSPTEDQALIGRTVEQFAATELRPHMRQHEQAGGVPEALRRSFRAIGLDLLNLPEAHGGLGADDRLRVQVNERLAHGDAGAALALSSWEPIALAIQELASPEHADHLYRLVAQAAARPGWGAVAFADDASGTGVRAVPGVDGYRLDGRKSFVTQAQGAALTLVLAAVEDGNTSGELALFALEGQPDGVAITPRPTRTGLQAAPVFDVALANVSVPEVARLRGGQGWLDGLRRLVGRAALQQAARCVGVMEAAWSYARDYASERQAFGKPVAHFQAIAFMLADMATLTEASRWSVWEAAWRFDQSDDRALRYGLAAAANAFHSVLRVTEDAVQILGGAGFIEDYPAEKWMREGRSLSLGWATGEGLLHTLGLELMGTAGEATPGELLPIGGLQPVFT